NGQQTSTTTRPLTCDTSIDDLGLAIGTTETGQCPSSCDASTVWGTDIYTHDSSICLAAIHAGVIQRSSGGTAFYEVIGGQSSYVGSTRNGVTTLDYGAWSKSFIFPAQTPSPSEDTGLGDTNVAPDTALTSTEDTSPNNDTAQINDDTEVVFEDAPTDTTEADTTDGDDVGMDTLSDTNLGDTEADTTEADTTEADTTEADVTDAAVDTISDVEADVVDDPDTHEDVEDDVPPDTVEPDTGPLRISCTNPSNPCCAADGLTEPEGTLCRAGARYRTYSSMDHIIWDYRCTEEGDIQWLEAIGRCAGHSATCLYDPTPDTGVWQSVRIPTNNAPPQFRAGDVFGCTCVDDGNGPYCDGASPGSRVSCGDPDSGFWSPGRTLFRGFRNTEGRTAVCLSDGRIAWKWANDDFGAFLCHGDVIDGQAVRGFDDVSQGMPRTDFEEGCLGFCVQERGRTCTSNGDCPVGECAVGICAHPGPGLPNTDLTDFMGWHFETCPDGKTCRTEEDGRGVYCGAPGGGCDPDSECCDAAGRALPDGTPCGERSDIVRMCSEIGGSTALVEARFSRQRCSVGRCGHAEHSWRDPTESRNPTLGGAVEVLSVEQICDGDLTCIGPTVQASCGQPWCADRYDAGVFSGDISASCIDRQSICTSGACCQTEVIRGVSVQRVVDVGTPCPSYESCFDNIDNNGNGDVDCDDIGCEGLFECRARWGEQRYVESFCNDGVDNDNNGDIDCDDAACQMRAPCQNTIRRHCADSTTIAVSIFEERCPGYSNAQDGQGEFTVSTCVEIPESASTFEVPCESGLTCGRNDFSAIVCQEAPTPICNRATDGVCCNSDGLSFAAYGTPCGERFPDVDGPLGRGGVPYCDYNDFTDNWDIIQWLAQGTCDGASATCRTNPDSLLRSFEAIDRCVAGSERCLNATDGSGARCLPNDLSVCDGGECCTELGLSQPAGTACSGASLAEERRCSLGGTGVERRQATPGCNSATATCSDSLSYASWTDWEVVETCGVGQACETQGPVTAACVTVPIACDGGPCCSDGVVINSSEACGMLSHETRYCLGAAIYATRFENSCEGTSPECEGPAVPAEQTLVETCDFACDDTGATPQCVDAPPPNPDDPPDSTPSPCGTTCIIGGICPGEDRICSGSNRCVPTECQACFNQGGTCQYDSVSCDVVNCELGGDNSGGDPQNCTASNQGTLTRSNFSVGGTLVSQMEVSYSFNAFGSLLVSTPYRYWPANAGEQVPASTRIYVGIRALDGSTWYTEFVTNRPEPGEWSNGFPSAKDTDAALCGGPNNPTTCLSAGEVQQLWNAGFCITGFIAAPG
ncbi:MAG: LCCL domain-containing protein, partial [Myxococcota bacterium]